jgi:hypothetical protein
LFGCSSCDFTPLQQHSNISCSQRKKNKANKKKVVAMDGCFVFDVKAKPVAKRKQEVFVLCFHQH